jgi:hypothetical protein
MKDKKQLAVGSGQLAVGSWQLQLAVGSWQWAVSKRQKVKGKR